MNYPIIKLKRATYATITQNKSGQMQNAYSPLHNLITDLGVSDFTTEKLKFNKEIPQDLLITDEYDGSTNILLTDDQNQPKLINTRFSVQENNTFLITEHYGNAVTNVYDDSALNNQIGLFKLYQHIPILEFGGLGEGMLKCGSYTFYFKLSDADGNLTNIIQHSGIVQVPIGELNTCKIRMGLEDENAGKSVKFKLSGLDAGFDYVRVFYERTTSGSDQAAVSEYVMIDQNFPILNGVSEFTITGAEKVVPIVLGDIQTEYADISTAKTQVIAQNILFLGNTSAFVHDYQALQQLAWQIYPSIVSENKISPDSTYQNIDQTYYNLDNVYNYTGYWPDEYYRFGVVFIYENNQLSPVFNILGCDLSESGILDPGKLYNDIHSYEKQDETYEKWDYEPSNYIFKEENWINSKGVVRFPKQSGVLTIQFNFDKIPELSKLVTSDTKLSEEQIRSYVKSILINHGIKGFFFVRQKRIPTIIAQGIAIGVTNKENGALPILKKDSGWVSKSFLKNRLLAQNGNDVYTYDKNVSVKGLLIPDAELQELTFNHIFTSQEFALDKIGSISFKEDKDLLYSSYSTFYSESSLLQISKLTAVPKETQLLTDGSNYFSSLAGNPQEAYKTSDIVNDWDNTVPQNLTKSSTLVRGQWGYYVGMSYSGYEYGDIINIKPKGFATNPVLQNQLEFQKRFADYSLYSPISTRYNIDNLKDSMQCYGGDCFNSVFTHRMMNNFADPELPTNIKIIDPKCWAKNYAVRSTAYIAKKSGLNFNCQKNNDGWYLTSDTYEMSKDPDTPTFSNEIAEMFEIDVMPYDMIGVTAEENDTENDFTFTEDEGISRKESSEFADIQFLSEDVIVGQTADKPASTKSRLDFFNKSAFGSLFPFGISFWINLAKWNKYSSGISEDKAFGLIYKKHPEPAKSGMKIIDAYIRLKNSQRSNYVQRGVSNINRSDVNAVSFGQWITFPIQSSMNLALRDIDFEHATEEASFNRKRSFYPLEEMNPKIHIPESNCINAAAKKSICTNQQVGFTMVPFIKQEYFNRIYWSKPNVAQNFINSYRMIFKEQFHEYNKEYGSITKLLSLGNALAVIFTHGIGLLEINKNPQSDQEKSPYLASKSVLPTDIQEITADYGSMWKDSILQTPSGIIYGVDTVAKKIWRLAGKQLDFISDQKIGKFLNEFITLSEFDINEYIGHLNVVTHYNEFKHDIIFTFKKDIPVYSFSDTVKNALTKIQTEELNILFNRDNYKYTSAWKSKEANFTLTIKDQSGTIVGEYPYIVRSGRIYYNNLDTGYKADVTWEEGTTWSICYNERMQQFITFYDWYPLLSENINNIFFSFDQTKFDSVYNNQKLIKLIEPSGFEDWFYLSKSLYDSTFNDQSKVYYLSQSGSNLENKFEINLTKSVNEDSCGYFCFYVSQNVKPIIKYQEMVGDKMVDINVQEVTYDFKDFEQIESYKFYAVKLNKTFTVTISYSTQSSDYLYLADPKIVVLTNNEYNEDISKPKVFKCFNLRNSAENTMYLWKHGQAGLYDNQGEILPTNWYGKQHEFNFEFVVNDEPMRQKIFNNLKILSNKAEPDKFEYEVVGEGYEWFDYKPIVQWINKMSKEDPKSDPDYWWKYVLGKTSETIQQTYPDFPDFKKQGYWDVNHTRTITKLPYLKMKHTDKKGSPERPAYEWEGNFETYWNKLNPNKDGSHKYGFNSNEVCLVKDNQMNEQRVRSESLGNNVKRYGRLRGNMEYLEDLWNVEIRPIQFKWCYLDPTDPDESVDFYITEPCTFQSSTFPTGHLIKSSAPAGSYTIKGNFTTTGDFGGSREPLMEGCLVICKSGTFSNMSPDLQDVLRMVYNDGKILNIVALNDQEYTLSFSESIDVVFLNIDANYLDDWLKHYTATTPPNEYVEYTDNGTFTFSVQLNCKIPPKLHFKKVETRHRDKYLKVKIRYSGKDLAIIQAIATMYDISYA